MKFPFFIASRIYHSDDAEGKISKPAVIIAMAGIAIGLAVMILSICIAVGFKHEIKEKVIGFGSHIQVANFVHAEAYESNPIVADDSLMQAIGASSPQVAHVQRFATKAGMLKTDDSFSGILLKGVGQEYDTTFIHRHLVEGRIPHFTDSLASNQAVVSRRLCQRMNLKLGDKLNTYFIQQNIRARRLTIVGIYETNFSAFDDRLLLTDLHTVRRLNNWRDPQLVSGIEVMARPEASLDECVSHVGSVVNHRVDRYGATCLAMSIDQLYPSIFAWLAVLDTNVWVILALMLGVAGFTMISGQLILILERTTMIGILKALGATDQMVRRIFLWFATMLIGKGLLWGNVVGLALCFLQRWLRIIRLDAETYYVDAVPIEFPWFSLLLINACTLLASLLVLVGPGMLISRIKPARVIRFE